RTVKNIVRLPPQLYRTLLAEPEILKQRYVRIENGRTARNVSRGVSGVGKSRRSGEAVRVQVQWRTFAVGACNISRITARYESQCIRGPASKIGDLYAWE